MAKLFIAILGVDHELQRIDTTGDFRTLVQGLIDQAPIDLVAEEAKESDTTVPRQIADARSIPWVGVDTTLGDKTRLGIYDELMNRPKQLIFDDSMHLGEKGKYLPRADGIREALWVSRTLARNSRGTIFVCGLLHLHQVADKFIAAGCEVVQTNVCEKDWYQQHYGEIKLFKDSDGCLWYEARYKTPRSIY